MHLAQRTILVLTAGALASCTVGPNFRAPHEPVAEHYAGIQSNSDDPIRLSESEELGVAWWRKFHDPELDHLQERAIAGNLDLKVAYLRIVEARSQLQSARAQGLPSLDASASYNREQLGIAGILKSQHATSGANLSPAVKDLIGSFEKPANIYQLGFDASWELDLFGKVRRAVEAADAQALATVEARNDLQVSLEAEVAQTYFQLRANQALQKILTDQVAAQQTVLELTANRHQNGLSSEVDVQSAQAQLSSLQGQLAPYDQSVAASRHALAMLVGEQPQALDTELAGNGTLPPVPEEAVPVGIPSTLARRRPDIRESEAALHAATAQVGVSVASLFPDVSLTGTYGLRNLSTGYLFDWDSRFYTGGSTISIPIFHGGALVSNVRLSRAQAAEAALNYRARVLGALQEVEDALNGLQADELRWKSQAEAFDADERALRTQLDAYEHGLVTYITVLTLQLQMVQAQQQTVQASLTQITDLVKLYKALGGGWNQPGQSAPSPPDLSLQMGELPPSNRSADPGGTRRYARRDTQTLMKTP